MNFADKAKSLALDRALTNIFLNRDKRKKESKNLEKREMLLWANASDDDLIEYAQKRAEEEMLSFQVVLNIAKHRRSKCRNKLKK